MVSDLKLEETVLEKSFFFYFCLAIIDIYEKFKIHYLYCDFYIKRFCSLRTYLRIQTK